MHGLREHIRFGVEVTEAAVDPATGHWTVHWKDGQGGSGRSRCNAMLTGVRDPNRPLNAHTAGHGTGGCHVHPHPHLGPFGRVGHEVTCGGSS